MLYVGLMHHYRVLCVLCIVINTHVTCPNRIGQTHDVRTCGRAIMHTWPPLAIAPQGRACSCEPSTTMSSRRADARVSHMFNAASRHARHGVHTCVLVWHETLGDTRSTTGEQTAVVCAFAWAPFVAASRAPPRTSWAAKLGSLAFKNGLSSEVRKWPSFLVQNLDQVLGGLYFYIQSGPWAIF